jgi:hypothetical protein
VIVEMKRCKQPAGKGTALTFTSADMGGGIYVVCGPRPQGGEKYSFRVNLGAPSVAAVVVRR